MKPRLFAAVGKLFSAGTSDRGEPFTDAEETIMEEERLNAVSISVRAGEPVPLHRRSVEEKLAGAKSDLSELKGQNALIKGQIFTTKFGAQSLRESIATLEKEIVQVSAEPGLIEYQNLAKELADCEASISLNGRNEKLLAAMAGNLGLITK